MYVGNVYHFFVSLSVCEITQNVTNGLQYNFVKQLSVAQETTLNYVSYLNKSFDDVFCCFIVSSMLLLFVVAVMRLFVRRTK